MNKPKNSKKIELFISKSKTLKRLGSLKKHEDYNLIIKTTIFLPIDSSVSRRLWHINNSFYDIPKCKMCDNDAPWEKCKGGYYRTYCSQKCCHTDPIILEKTKNTNIKKYGHTTAMQNNTIREKIVNKWKDNYGVDNPSKSNTIKQKKKETSIQNWGTDHPLQSEQLKEKRDDTNFEKYGARNVFASDYGKEKIKKTIMELYNVEYVGNSIEVQQKRKETVLKKYNAEHVWCSNTSSRIKQQNTMIEKYGNLSKSPLPKQIQEKLKNNKWLHTQYQTKERSIENIAEELNVSHATICNYLHKHNITIITRPASEAEREIVNFIKTVISTKIVTNSRKIIPPFELDIFLPQYNLAIEYNGLYWHSEFNNKDKNYHITKTNLCDTKGIHLIHIMEDEWRDQKQKCKDTIRHLLGESPKGIYARKTNIQEISWKIAKQFLIKYHLLNAGQPGNYRIGAYNDEELIGVMVFGNINNENSGKNNIELKRFVTNKKNNPGLGSKMFKHAISQKNYDEVIAFVDRRWFTGLVKSYIGFTVLHVTSPSVWWTDYKNRYHRRFITKEKLIANGFPANISKAKILLSEGYSRIWDCGKIKLIWQK